MDRIAWILNLREPFGAALGRELVSRGWKVIGGDPGEKEKPNSEAQRVSGLAEGEKIGENPDVPTGSGSSGFEDFEGSMAFGPETNGRSVVKKSEAQSEHSKRDALTDRGEPLSADNPLPEHGKLKAFPLDPDQPGELERAVQATAELATHIDLLILNTDESSETGGRPIIPADAAAFREEETGFSMPETVESRLYDYETYALTPLRIVEKLLPLMEAEDRLKRICFISSHEGSISAGGASVPISRAMARTALHMQAKLLFNDLRRSGYTFRLYDPGLSRSSVPSSDELMGSIPGKVAESARFAAGFFTNPHADEERLVLTGSRGEEWPF
ncbi:hypothetical protein [Saccharibacillus endophyticus]|uniref:SDR family NAD(P)-dependent oxidoreductase n=1 Tax=Saccharibacillus endophyticus TaxID=2060666 RepID=A0ABQ1ZW10_9BACL|nr:hypothetical protein [Saccharibacillus endophyticus]GGH79075.1 hypothetical protein GCM10007362_25320 [Saccharibacillus endophyticus]